MLGFKIQGLLLPLFLWNEDLSIKLGLGYEVGDWAGRQQKGIACEGK